MESRLKEMMRQAEKEVKARKKAWRDLFPMTVKKINLPEELGAIKPAMFGRKPGTLVAVRPCGEKYGDKTYVGLLIGDVALAAGVNYDKKKKHLNFGVYHYNPAILVPELGEVIYGCASWWHPIESEADLKHISDKDINNVWYVKLMKDQAEKLSKEPANGNSDKCS